MATPYIILGHGTEDPDVDVRPSVPAGCVLVVAEECGTLGTVPPHIYDAITTPEHLPLFMDPVAGKAALETLLKKKLRIYTAGQSYPSLSYTLLSDSDDGVEPSGVYSLPVPAVAVEYYPDRPLGRKYLRPLAEAGLVYEESLQPTSAAVTGKTAEEILTIPGVRTTQEALFAAFPGVHFNLLCRGVEDATAFLRGGLMTFGLSEETVDDMLDITRVIDPWSAVHDWIESLDMDALTEAQRITVAQLKERVDEILAKRVASGSPLEEQTYNALYRLYQSGNRDPATVLAAVAALPAAEVNHRGTHDGMTPLMLAVRLQSLPAVQALLGRGANVNHTDFYGTPVLMMACEEEQLDIVNALLAAGAIVAVTDENGDTPASLAAAAPPLVPVLQTLITDPGYVNTAGESLLYIAASYNNLAAIPILAAATPVNRPAQDGKTPLHVAIEKKFTEVAMALTDVPGIDINARVGQKTALGFALQAKLDAVGERLIQRGVVAAWPRVAEIATQAKMPKTAAAATAKQQPPPAQPS